MSEILPTIVLTVEVPTTVVVDVPVTTVLHEGMQGPPGPAGGGGDSAYIRTTPTPSALGGVGAGTTFNTTVVGVLDQLLYPYQSPAFTGFSFAQSSPLEAGDTMNAGDKSFSWTYSNAANITADTLQVSDVTTSTVLGTALPITSPRLFTLPAITNMAQATHTWRISATNTNTVSFSRDFSVAWYWRTCYGESTNTSLTSADILALRVTGLSASFSGTKAFLGGGYKWVCYPTTFGLRTVFKDTATNLDVAMVPAVTVAVTNAFGVTQNYYAHRTLNILGGAINIAIS